MATRRELSNLLKQMVGRGFFSKEAHIEYDAMRGWYVGVAKKLEHEAGYAIEPQGGIFRTSNQLLAWMKVSWEARGLVDPDDFSRPVARGSRKTDEIAELKKEIAALKAENERLKEQLARKRR